MVWRMSGAVLAGVAVWTALWAGATRASAWALPALVAPDRPLTHPGVLWSYIVFGTALSVLAGAVTAGLARRWGARTGAVAIRAVGVLAVLQMSFGIVAEVSYWNLMPVWYHVVFLAPVIPATVAGGRLWLGRQAAPEEGRQARSPA